MDKANILKLANMSRVDISENEINDMSKSIDSILSYVDQVKNIQTKNIDTGIFIGTKNQLREDDVFNKKESFTKDVLDEMPDSENGFLKVKKIL